MASPPPGYTYDGRVMQSWVDQESVPAFRAKIIDTLNKQCAQKRRSVILRQPQPNPMCHCTFMNYSWSTEEAERCLSGDGRLPCDLSTVDQYGDAILIWIFDASIAGGQLPELELDPVPDFDKHPALCIFDMAGSVATGDEHNVALIPSEFLEMIPRGGKKVKFVLKANRSVEQFANLGGL